MQAAQNSVTRADARGEIPEHQQREAGEDGRRRRITTFPGIGEPVAKRGADRLRDGDRHPAERLGTRFVHCLDRDRTERAGPGEGITVIRPILMSAACARCRRAEASPPASVKTEAVAHESDLLKLTSTPDAPALEDRHGLGSSYSAAATHDSRGEIVVPTGASGLPTNSVSTLTQPGTQQVAADGEAAWSRAQVGRQGSRWAAPRRWCARKPAASAIVTEPLPRSPPRAAADAAVSCRRPYSIWS